MNFKKIGLMLVALIVTLGLAGCSVAQLPEGDVKVVKQDVSGVISLLLESVGYGQDQSTVASMLLPTGFQYDVTMHIEQYENGELVNTISLPPYTTEILEKNSIIHMILNVGKGDVKSIYSLAEVDKEQTINEKNPEYKVTKKNESPFDFDARTEIVQYGGTLGQDVVLAGYVKYKDGGTKEGIELIAYKDQVANYAAANIVKVQIVQK